MAPEETRFIGGYGLADYTRVLDSVGGWDARVSYVETLSGAHTAVLDEAVELSQVVTAAAALTEWLPTVLAWACTRRSFLFGRRGAINQISALEARFGIPAVSASLAFSSALEYLGLRRVAVLGSYPLDVSEKFASFIREANCSVTELAVMDLPSGIDAAQLPPDMLIRRAADMKLTDAEAVLIPDTALHTVDVVGAIEKQIERPVLTANQVTLWHAFHRVGYRPNAPALGHLFSAAPR